jgi:hypothetical protein
LEVAAINFFLIEMFNKGVKDHFIITCQGGSVIEGYGADYPIS